jgi:antitoxin component YwqK of YwqJK toxin-antitoxin module
MFFESKFKNSNQSNNRRDYELEYLQRMLDKYESNPNHVFKTFTVNINDPKEKDTKNQSTWIVIMKKLPDTITNESSVLRFHSEMSMYSKCATFTADKLKVLRISKIDNDNFFSDVHVKSLDTYHNTFTVGEIVSDMKNAFKLEYFKTIYRAYYDRDVPNNFSGSWRYWYDNGETHSIYEYLNGKKTGAWSEYWKSDNSDDGYGENSIKADGFYYNDLKFGKWTGYFRTSRNYIFSQKSFEVFYDNDLKSGDEIKYWNNGQIFTSCSYDKGKQIGPKTFWSDSGVKTQICHYDQNGNFKECVKLE